MLTALETFQDFNTATAAATGPHAHRLEAAVGTHHDYPAVVTCGDKRGGRYQVAVLKSWKVSRAVSTLSRQASS